MKTKVRALTGTLAECQERYAELESKIEKFEFVTLNNGLVTLVYVAIEERIEEQYPEHFVPVFSLKKYSDKVSHYTAYKKDIDNKGRVISKKFKDEYTAKCWVGSKENGKVNIHYHKQYILIGELQNGEEVRHKSVSIKRLEKIASQRNLENVEILQA